MSDIVERLRVSLCDEPCGPNAPCNCRDAGYITRNEGAAEIERLRAENAKLRTERDKLFKSNAELAEIIAALQERARYDQSQWY